MRYPKRHSTYGRVIVKTIQLFLGKYKIMGLLHVACCKIDFEKSLQEGEMYNYKSYIYYIYYNMYNIYKIICNYFFE